MDCLVGHGPRKKRLEDWVEKDIMTEGDIMRDI